MDMTEYRQKDLVGNGYGVINGAQIFGMVHKIWDIFIIDLKRWKLLLTCSSRQLIILILDRLENHISRVA